MSNWMTRLAAHYNMTRNKYPNDRIMIVFDIDGTILDMRYVILHVLKTFDKSHSTRHFNDLEVADIDFHEEHIESFLERLHISSNDQMVILEQYKKLFWSSAGTFEAHRPFRGVLEVIRWFQMQSRTYIALNTGRPESLRFQTLNTLNRLADEYRVHFGDDLLYMKPDGSEQTIPEIKADGIRHFTRKGYRVCAVVDNEPENLYAVSRADPQREILLLHADTIFKSKRDSMPGYAVNGKKYDLTALISNNAHTQHTQFVWDCTHDTERFHQFIRSNIHWVQLDPCSFLSSASKIPCAVKLPDIAPYLTEAKKHGKKIKLHLHKRGELMADVLKMVSGYGFDASSVCIDLSISAILDAGKIKMLRCKHPGMIIQFSADFLASAILNNPARAREVLEFIRSHGIDRFSVNWMLPKKREIITRLMLWGLEVDVNNVHGLEPFLQAALIAPSSITSHFNFLEHHREEYRSDRFIA